jgi:hypothetical protein
MKPTLLIRHIFSTIIYAGLLAVILALSNIAMTWILHAALIPMFQWFVGISIFWKIMLWLAGITSIFTLIVDLFSMGAGLINFLMSRVFLENTAMIVVSLILCMGNLIFCVVGIWPFLHWDFWIIMFWLLIFGFIWQVNWMFVYKGKLR